MPIDWKREGNVYTATLHGHACKVVLFPEDSPLAGKFGCFRDGQFQGVAATLAAAKGRCGALAHNKPKWGQQRRAAPKFTAS